MKTKEEILSKIAEWQKTDFLGFKVGDLLATLCFEDAKPFLKEGTTAEEWGQPDLTSDEKVKAKMLDYMPFAWDKAINCRGLSAGRSMSHYVAWMWLIGDDGKLGDLEDYEYYGKDNLVAICNLYGWDSSQWDDGIRINSESEL